MENPVRATIMIQDEGLEQVREQYMSYLNFSNPYSWWRLAMFRNTYKFKGIKESDFERKLQIRDLIIAEEA